MDRIIEARAQNRINTRPNIRLSIYINNKYYLNKYPSAIRSHSGKLDTHRFIINK